MPRYLEISRCQRDIGCFPVGVIASRSLLVRSALKTSKTSEGIEPRNLKNFRPSTGVLSDQRGANPTPMCWAKKFSLQGARDLLRFAGLDELVVVTVMRQSCEKPTRLFS